MTACEMSAAKVHDIFARASKHSAKKKMSPLVSVAVAVVSFHMKCGPEDQEGGWELGGRYSFVCLLVFPAIFSLLAVDI